MHISECKLQTLVCKVIHCPELIDVENATRDSNDTYYDKRILYSCLPGYQYPDKEKKKIVRCTENETWTDFPPPCEGSLLFLRCCIKRRLQLRFDCDSTAVRLPFDCSSIALRPFFVTAYTCSGLLHCGLNR